MSKYVAWGLLGFLAVITIVTCNVFITDGAKTVTDQFKPSTLLKKYEYFKDLAAGIDKKRADIAVYQEELSDYKIEDKEDKFYFEQRKSELFGLITMHNTLCSEYNSAMSKFNYRFTNKGDLPSSNLEPLPREFKPYILSIKKQKT